MRSPRVASVMDTNGVPAAPGDVAAREKVGDTYKSQGGFFATGERATNVQWKKAVVFSLVAAAVSMAALAVVIVVALQGGSGNENTGLLAERASANAPTNNPVEWSPDGGQRCIQNAALRPGPVIELRQADFADGTYRIRTPGRYEVVEDISFEPSPLFPPKNTSLLSFGGPTVLGFFSAITIETSNVLLDLRGHTIAGSTRFNHIQNPFSIITLGDQPFARGFGSPQFALQKHTPAPVTNHVSILNGTLGFANHMGVHGIEAKGLCIHNVTIKHFMVSGITLNGVSNVDISNVDIGPSVGVKDAPRVLLNADGFRAQQLLRIVDGGPFESSPQITTLRNFMDEVLEDILNGNLCGEEGNSRKCKLFPFFNPSGKLWGSALYGISLHDKSPGVHDLAAFHDGMYEEQAANPLSGFNITDVRIHDLEMDNKEVLKMFQRVNADGFVQFKPASDVVGGSFVWERITAEPNWTYRTDVMTEAVRFMALQQRSWLDAQGYARDGHDVEAGSVVHETMLNRFGTVYVPASVLEWMDGARSFAQLLEDVQFRCGFDYLTHSAKGVIGLRAEAAQAIVMERVTIEGLHSTGTLDSLRHLCEDTAGPTVSAPYTSDAYKGWDVRGGFFAFSTGTWRDFHVHDLNASDGRAYGVELHSSAMSPQGDDNGIEVSCVTGMLGTDVTVDGWHPPNELPADIEDLFPNLY